MTNFAMSKFVMTKFVVTKFVITKFVITKFATTEFHSNRCIFSESQSKLDEQQGESRIVWQQSLDA